MQARQAVFNLLLRVNKGGAYSNIALNAAFTNTSLGSKDKAFATALFYGVLEREITLEEIIKRLAENKRVDDFAKTAIKMGLYQIIFMNSVPDNAAVNESVKLVKGKGAKGFVNAVLRQYLRVGGEILKDAPVWLKYSCPEWLYKKWCKEYGEENSEGIIKETVGKAPVVCRVNTLKTTENELIDILKSEGITAEKSDYNNALVLNNISLSECKAFCDGLFHIEDISAQMAADILAPSSGEKVLDLCAAPGGKTFTMAELMEDKGEIYAFDLHKKRVNLISENAKRLGISIITAQTGDATEFNESLSKADKVLCDVPCSGLGIIRRKPEIKYKKASDFERLPDIQYNILSNGAKYVKDGGSLVYSTCTLSRDENDNVVRRFLDGNNEFKLIRCETVFPSKLRDGFFIAKFERK